MTQNAVETSLFIALDIQAPWPDQWPKGRIIQEEFRHLTLLFLGKTNLEKTLSVLNKLPKIFFPFAKIGFLDEVLFLPNNVKSPRVCAYHVDFKDEIKTVFDFQDQLLQTFKKAGFEFSEQDYHFLPHISIARNPQDMDQWKKITQPLPAIFPSLHLYESLGYSSYRKLWSREFILGFEQLPHTADIAYAIRGKDYNQLLKHAEMALAFEFHPFCRVIDQKDSIEDVNSINEIVKRLNKSVSLCDIESGVPFKAVSYHDQVKAKKNYLEWEMIIDV